MRHLHQQIRLFCTQSASKEVILRGLYGNMNQEIEKNYGGAGI